MNQSREITSDEKMIGAVAHVFGPLAALIVWAIQKDRSRFVKFQAIQALTFDVVVIIVSGVLGFCTVGLIMLATFGMVYTFLNNPSSSDEFISLMFMPTLFPFSVFLCLMPISILILALRMIAAVSILNGRDYRYPIIGKWLSNTFKD